MVPKAVLDNAGKGNGVAVLGMFFFFPADFRMGEEVFVVVLTGASKLQFGSMAEPMSREKRRTMEAL
jgi:hypothetical protein